MKPINVYEKLKDYYGPVRAFFTAQVVLVSRFFVVFACQNAATCSKISENSDQSDDGMAVLRV